MKGETSSRLQMKRVFNLKAYDGGELGLHGVDVFPPPTKDSILVWIRLPSNNTQYNTTSYVTIHSETHIHGQGGHRVNR